MFETTHADKPMCRIPGPRFGEERFAHQYRNGMFGGCSAIRVNSSDARSDGSPLTLLVTPNDRGHDRLKLARIIHQGWRAWRKPLIGHRIRLRDLNPIDVGAHARQG
jgi:hypothetical protein